MARSILLALLAACVLAAASSATAPVAGQESIVVQSDRARNEFPRGVSFTIAVTTPSPVKEARLRYRVAPDGREVSAIAECSGSGTVTCTYMLTSGRGIFVIPAAEITYHWEITPDSGNRLLTQDQLYVHEDTRFDFQTKRQGNVTAYYHAGTAGDVDVLLAAAVDTLETIGALERTQVAFPVKLFLYETADEMSPAIVQIGGRGVQTLGEVPYSDTAMVSVDIAPLDITRHEIAHIVTREATKGAFGISDWMNEGISVFAQRNLLSNQQTALDEAVRRDRVLSFLELGSSTAGDSSSTVSLYYAQAGAIVRYLVETYGAEKFADLLRTFREGSTPDKAYNAVYGFNERGFEDRWRESVGLPPAEDAPTPASTAAASPAAAATPRAGDGTSDGGASAGTVALIVGLAAAALAALAVVALVALRRLR